MPYKSFGWYQSVQVTAGDAFRIDGWWRGDTDPAGWAELMLFWVPEGTSAAVIESRIRNGTASDVAFRKEGSVWDWELASAAPAVSGDAGHFDSAGQVVVATKLATTGSNLNSDGLYAEFDWTGSDRQGPVTTPEPGALGLLIGAAGLIFVFRRVQRD